LIGKNLVPPYDSISTLSIFIPVEAFDIAERGGVDERDLSEVKSPPRVFSDFEPSPFAALSLLGPMIYSSLANKAG